MARLDILNENRIAVKAIIIIGTINEALLLQYNKNEKIRINIGKPNFATSATINGAAIAAMRTPPRLFFKASIGFSPLTKISNNVPNARELLTPPNIFLNGPKKPPTLPADGGGVGPICPPGTPN